MAEQSHADYRGSGARLGRYALYGEIASGGMATVHLGRVLGSAGFTRTVAIKRLHPHLAKDPEFVHMFLDEARLAARVRHPNVVATVDVVSEDGELFLVMEYVAGESLSRLVRKTREAGGHVPPRYLVAIICGALEGLHAAHEAKSERGEPLGIVHRDVSPQNIHVGIDGVARVLDFGIAKATNRVQETRTDQIKGKVAYMSPEQLAKGAIDRRADVYSASVVLWEALTGERLFRADDVPSLVYSIVHDEIVPPSEVMKGLPKALDPIVMRGLERDASKRWPSTRAMAEALERVLTPAPARMIGEWVEALAGEALAWRQDLVAHIEREGATSTPPPGLLPSEAPIATHLDATSGIVASDPNLPPVREDLPTIPHTDIAPALASDAPPPSAPPAPPAFVDLTTQPTPTPLVSTDRGAGSATEIPTSRAGRVATIAAVLVLLSGAGLAALRLRQLEQAPNGPPTAPTASQVQPAQQEESAIVLGIQRAPTPSASASSRADCDPPFVVDARGNRHPRPGCPKK